ncbi:hypothetical protein EES45_18990 [Streptomyces sp. ADI97-07]|uniref:Uncharacterized protein n=1 Tax=Streptomyces clavifer TaxID=68188 RepID=A0ABS4V9T0_9ACTN|nr:hypothetical protein [Streptomyces clavifer]RPK78092.1 hypothetical protein EES45_18990 [Streptomyces sp. ADI97-07]
MPFGPLGTMLVCNRLDLRRIPKPGAHPGPVPGRPG